MPLPNFAGLSVSRDSIVIPQRQSKEGTIVRPVGFTSNLSSMDVPRAGVAAKKSHRVPDQALTFAEGKTAEV